MTTAPDEFQHVLQDRMRQAQRNNRKRLALTIALVLAVGVPCTVLGPPAVYVFAVAALVWVAFGLWAMRPGQCVVCGARTSSVAPKGRPPVPERAWWDLRNPSRKDFVHVCFRDYPAYLVARVLRAREEDDAKAGED